MSQLTSVQGIYEVCIGVTDAIASVQYWERFGYDIGQVGELSATTAQQLYGIELSLVSIRLRHQNADHGLIRLMMWSHPITDQLPI
jgi:hypothetical protein